MRYRCLSKNLRMRNTIAAVIFFFSVDVAKADFDFSFWNLETVVSQFGDGGGLDFASFQVVETPFAESHMAMVNASTAFTEYLISWDNDLHTASFDITFDHFLSGGRVNDDTTGDIIMTTSVDLIISATGSLEYAHVPGDEVRVGTGMTLSVWPDGGGVFSVGESGGNGNFQPAAGTLMFSDSAVLPADTYLISYGTRIDTIFEDNPQGSATSFGSFHFDLVPVPEPATLFLVTVPMACFARRRRRHSR